MRRFVVASTFVLAVLALPVLADSDLLKFDGGIGVIPAGLAGPNVVRGVQPGGQVWVIDRLTATVGMDGEIRVDGRGLLLGGGNGIGTNASQSVKAELFCGPAATATLSQSGTVPLDEAGDFRIDEQLTPPPPNPCESPVLLIVSANDRWFAAGIPKR
jgi:hypothetical protein